MKTFTLLQKGDSKVIDIYKEANIIWEKEFSRQWSVTSLADRLSSLQTSFEHTMSKYDLDRWEGQEIFVVSGLTFFSDEEDCNAKFAEKVREAFELSFCSIEVKGFSKRLSKALYLGGY